MLTRPPVDHSDLTIERGCISAFNLSKEVLYSLFPLGFILFEHRDGTALTLSLPYITVYVCIWEED